MRPEFVQAYYYLGRAVAARGQLEEAVGYFRQAVRLRPDFAEAHESLGRALAQQGKRNGAMKHYQEALRILKSRRTRPGPGD